VSGQLHASAALTPAKELPAPIGESWTDPRTGLDDIQKLKFLTLPGLKLRPFSHPSRSHSLYLLRYRGSLLLAKMFISLSNSQRNCTLNKQTTLHVFLVTGTRSGKLIILILGQNLRIKLIPYGMH
jgi:hypothetical protein